MDNTINDGSGSNLAPGTSSPLSNAAPGTATDQRPDGYGPALVREGAAIEAATTAANPDIIKLSDGREARILNAKGSIIPQARRIMSEDGSNFQDCMVALVTIIDGRPIIIEELYDLPLKDALAIQARFNEKNA